MTLFITDDDDDDKMFMSEALAEKGFNGTLQTFSNGSELVSHLLKTDAAIPDLIVLDINMPVMDGYEALEILKKDHQLKKIPVIMLTSSSKHEDEKTCYNLGCDGFFRKPLSYLEFLGLAGNIIDFKASS
jgi:CheY-like chemotaxis protein